MDFSYDEYYLDECSTLASESDSSFGSTPLIININTYDMDTFDNCIQVVEEISKDILRPQFEKYVRQKLSQKNMQTTIISNEHPKFPMLPADFQIDIYGEGAWNSRLDGIAEFLFQTLKGSKDINKVEECMLLGQIGLGSTNLFTKYRQLLENAKILTSIYEVSKPLVGLIVLNGDKDVLHEHLTHLNLDFKDGLLDIFDQLHVLYIPYISKGTLKGLKDKFTSQVTRIQGLEQTLNKDLTKCKTQIKDLDRNYKAHIEFIKRELIYTQGQLSHTQEQLTLAQAEILHLNQKRQEDYNKYQDFINNHIQDQKNSLDQTLDRHLGDTRLIYHTQIFNNDSSLNQLIKAPNRDSRIESKKYFSIY